MGACNLPAKNAATSIGGAFANELEGECYEMLKKLPNNNENILPYNENILPYKVLLGLVPFKIFWGFFKQIVENQSRKLARVSPVSQHLRVLASALATSLWDVCLCSRFWVLGSGFTECGAIVALGPTPNAKPSKLALLFDVCVRQLQNCRQFWTSGFDKTLNPKP